MPDDVYKKLLEFEKILKKCIIDRFNGIMPQHKVDIINNTEYLVTDELLKLSGALEIQGKILRDMLDSIIDIKFIKDVPIDEFTETYILFAEDIENDILEYYSKDISIKYKFDVNFTKNDFPYAIEMKSLLGDDFDYVMLNKNTGELLNDERLKDFSKLYEMKVANQFAKSDVQSPIVEINDDSTEEIINNLIVEEIIDSDDDVPVPILPNTYENSKEFLLEELTDEDNNLNINNDGIVDVVIQDNVPNVIIDNPIQPVIPEKKADETFIQDEDDNNINLVELKSDNNINPINEDINLIEIKPDISTTDNSDENFDVQKEHKVDNYSILSDDQYKELCLKYARDENITEEELNLLLRSTPQLLDNNQEKMVISQSQEDDMQPERKVRGFTNNSFSTYFIIISTILALLLIYFML